MPRPKLPIRIQIAIGACACFLLMSVLPVTAASRVSLVIGNSAYQHTTALPNSQNDATDVAGSLGRLGFSVKRVIDGTFEEMRRALLEFGHMAREAEIAVVFFAGHGMEIGGENWLVPVDAQLRTDLDVDQEAIPLRSLMVSVSAASKLGIVILDSCRNNPFAAKMKRTVRTRAVEKGFVAVEPSTGVLVAYAAKAGTTAADGTGRNSPFSAALLRHIETPGLEVNFLFRHIRDDVITATKREQEPFVYGSLSRDPIYLKPAPSESNLNAEEIAWSLVKDSTDLKQLELFSLQFPNSKRRVEVEKRAAHLREKASKELAATNAKVAQAASEMLIAKATIGARIEKSEIIRSVQMELKRLGCLDGAVDGEFTETTRAAVARYTKSRSSGTTDLEPNLELVQKLRNTHDKICDSREKHTSSFSTGKRTNCFNFVGREFCE